MFKVLARQWDSSEKIRRAIRGLGRSMSGYSEEQCKTTSSWRGRAWAFSALMVISTASGLLAAQSEGNRAPQVVNQFINLQQWGDPLAVRLVDGGLDFGSPSPLFYNKHYQGMARAQGANGVPYIFLSRSRNPNKVCFTELVDLSDGSECGLFLPGELLTFEMTPLLGQPAGFTSGERLGSNLLERGTEFEDTVPSDSEVSTLLFDGSELPYAWHPGGMQEIDGVLGVSLTCPCGDTDDFLTFSDGLTQKQRCEIQKAACGDFANGGMVLVDIEDPANPTALATIPRAFGDNGEPRFPSSGEGDFGGSIAITRQADGNYLFALVGGTGHSIYFTKLDTGGQRLNVFLRQQQANGTPIADATDFDFVYRWEDGADGAEPFRRQGDCSTVEFSTQTVSPPGLPPGQPWDCFQNASFVREDDSNRLYLILGGNDTTRLDTGGDLMVLLEVVENELESSDDFTQLFSIKYIASRIFESYDAIPSMGDFDAAQSVYVSPSGLLTGYSAMHGADEVDNVDVVRMGEFKTLSNQVGQCGALPYRNDGAGLFNPGWPGGVFNEVTAVCQGSDTNCIAKARGLFAPGQILVVDQNTFGLSGALQLQAPEFSLMRPWITLMSDDMALTLDSFREQDDNFDNLARFDAPNSFFSPANTFDDDPTGYVYCGLRGGQVSFYRDDNYGGGELRQLVGDDEVIQVYPSTGDPALDDDVSSVSELYLVPQDLWMPNEAGIPDTRYHWEFRPLGSTQTPIAITTEGRFVDFPYDQVIGNYEVTLRIFDKTLSTVISVRGDDPTLGVTVSGNGEVVSDPPGLLCIGGPSEQTGVCQSQFPPNSVVTLTATPSPGSSFSQFSACFCAGGTPANVCRKTLSASNFACQVIFTAPNQILDVDIIGQGRVTSEPAGIDCDQNGGQCTRQFPTNTSIELTPTPDPGWEFVGWEGLNGAVCTDGNFPLTSSRTCIARFTNPSVSLGVNIGGVGAVVSDVGGINCAKAAPGDEAGPTCQVTLDRGTSVSLSPSPLNRFLGWSGSPACQSDPLLMNDDALCIASFAENVLTYALTVQVTGNGAVTSDIPGISCGSDCSEVFDYGTDVMLLPTPGPGAYFAGWSGSLDCIDGIVSMTGLRDCRANFITGSNGFTGAFANATWEIFTQNFGCGSSAVNATTTELVITTANDCAISNGKYTHNGAPTLGNIIFDYEVTRTSNPTFIARVSVLGQSSELLREIILADSQPASGTMTVPIRSDERLEFQNRKSANFGVTTLRIINFRFVPVEPMIFRSRFQSDD
jgi:hypothetical protein